ncbi:baseplate J/gp47 family protein [Serratia symbiotica]|nr:baseplate J/gp47 family protein [Serratia symbiotica]
MIDTIRGDLLTQFNEYSVLRRLDAEVYTRVQAAAIHTIYGYINYLARNILPDLANEDWLTRHSNIKLCPRKGATNASGFIRWEDVQNALSLSADTEIHRDDGQIYTITAPITSANGVLLAYRSLQKAAVRLSIVRMALRYDLLRLFLVYLRPSTGYADNIGTGADIEDLDSWRQRIMAHWYDTSQWGAG